MRFRFDRGYKDRSECLWECDSDVLHMRTRVDICRAVQSKVMEGGSGGGQSAWSADDGKLAFRSVSLAFDIACVRTKECARIAITGQRLQRIR